tara:strand:+ start:172 stop:354 length:183 start_codon:yes stop_codon:yes gene_type:complete
MATIDDLDRRLRLVEIKIVSNTDRMDTILKNQLSTTLLTKYIITPLIVIVGVLAGVKLIF